MTEEAVHLTTGSPLPADIERIVTWLLNEDFQTAFARKNNNTSQFPLFSRKFFDRSSFGYSFLGIQRIKTEKGLALLDIITEVHPYIIPIELPQSIKMYLAECLSQIE